MGLYGSVKGYIQRRKYQRIDESIKTRRRRLRIAKMGGGRRRRIWRLKLSPRLKLRWFNPKVLLMKLRDAYVKMMLSAANSRVFSTEMMGFYGNPFGQRSVKEYDPKMLIEIYKSYMVQEQGYTREMQSQVA